MTTTAIQDLNWEAIQELIAAGQIARTDDLSCFDHDTRKRNITKAIASGKPACVHCGKAVNIKTAWVFRAVADSDWRYALSIDSDLQFHSTWRIVGSTCGPEFLDTSFLRRANTVDVNEIQDATFNY